MTPLAEHKILATCVSQPELFALFSRRLMPKHFNELRHERLWHCLQDLSERGAHVSVESLRHYPQLDYNWLLELSCDLYPCGEAEARAWVAEVLHEYETRTLRLLIESAADRISEGKGASDWLLEGLLDLKRDTHEEPASLEDNLRAAIEGVINRPTGYSTGLVELDAMMNGLWPGNLTVIGGRPGQGKTALALCIAAHLALKQRLEVQFFSLEMTSSELALRLACSLSDVSSSSLRRGHISEAERARFAKVVSKIADLPLSIDDSAALAIGELCARARAKKPGVVFVDYLGLLHSEQRHEKRYQEVGHIAKSLKTLAKTLQVPVILLSQLRRDSGRPQLTDLRESGDIEAHADVVLFVYREEVERPEDLSLRGKAELLVRKNRQGPLGDAEVGFIGETTTFCNVEVL